jgi:hypothetical protein
MALSLSRPSLFISSCVNNIPTRQRLKVAERILITPKCAEMPISLAENSVISVINELCLLGLGSGLARRPLGVDEHYLRLITPWHVQLIRIKACATQII